MEPDSIGNVHAVPVIVELDDVIHVRKAVKQMKCNKAFGGDGIPAGVYTHGDTTLVELKHASIVTIFKRGLDSVNRIKPCGHASPGLGAHLNVSTSTGNYTTA